MQMPVPVVRCAWPDLLLADLSVSVVFCYDRPLDTRTLRSGFDEALVRVPVFAGRLRPAAGAGLEIVCDGGGAQLREFDSPLTLAEAIGRLGLPDSGLVDHVDGPAARAGRGPVTRVRINRLADGTTILGCSWHHAIGDMSSFTAFMRQWSASSAGAELEAPLLVEDRAAYLDALLPEKDGGRTGFRVVDEEESAALRRVAESSGLANRIVQVYFGEAELARMRTAFEREAGRRLSTNDVATAHVVRTVRRVDGDTEERDLVVPVDLRRPLGVPESVIGNLLGEITLRAGDTHAAHLAADLRAAVEEFADAHLKLRTSQTVLEELGPDGLSRCVPLGFNPAERTFTVSSWRGFGAYTACFDGASPVLMAPAISLPLPWVCWSVEGFDGSGILCTLAVPAAVATRLRSADGRALLHPARDPHDPLPALAAAVRRLL
jgi:Transferase family